MNEKARQVSRSLERIRRHPYFSLMVFVGSMVIALASFSDSLTKLTDFAMPLSPERARAKLVEMAIPFDNAAFVEAAAKGDLSTVKLFLAAGMDPNAEAERDVYEGQTALIVSAREAHLPVVKALL